MRNVTNRLSHLNTWSVGVVLLLPPDPWLSRSMRVEGTEAGNKGTGFKMVMDTKGDSPPGDRHL